MTYLRRAILAFALMTGIAPALAQAPPSVPALPDAERRTTYSITNSTCGCTVGFALCGESKDYGNWLEVFVNGALVPSTSDHHQPERIARNPSAPHRCGSDFTSVQTGTVQIVGACRPRAHVAVLRK